MTNTPELLSNLAERRYSEALQRLVDLDNPNRKIRPDRTGTGTYSLPGVQLVYPANPLPILSGKKVFTQSAIRELCWMLRGETNTATVGSKIWEEWQVSEPNPGLNLEKRPLQWVSYRDCEGGASFKGVWSPPQNLTEVDACLGRTWSQMIRRCYDPSKHTYKYYGAKGVRVCERWHTVETFIQDAKLLPNWLHKESDPLDYQLDKDYYGASTYGPDTCVWLHKSENPMYTSQVSAVVYTSPCGATKEFVSQAHCASSLNVPPSSLHRWLDTGTLSGLKRGNTKFNGAKFTSKGVKGKSLRFAFTFGELGNVYGYQMRFWCSPVTERNQAPSDAVLSPTGTYYQIDQVARLITKLKKEPYTRKAIVSMWNAGELHSMALSPCHAFYQFRTASCGTRIDLILTQPSGDMFLGVPFNMLNASVLLTLVCWAVGKEPGWIYHNIGDCHLYSNHLEQAKRYLSNEPRHCSPVLEWAEGVTEERKSELFSNAYIDIQANELKIKGYEPGPVIRAEISV